MSVFIIKTSKCFTGKILEDDKPLSNYKIEEKNFVVVMVTKVKEIMGMNAEPRHEKTCLREFPTTPDANRPAQPQELARILKFRL